MSKYDLEYEIVNKIGILSKGKSGWKKELTFTSWNGKPAKFEIRDWNEDYTKCGKGITLTAQEIKTLYSLLEQSEI